VTSYLEVITAQRLSLRIDVNAVKILGRRMANTVLLIQALAAVGKVGCPSGPSVAASL